MNNKSFVTIMAGGIGSRFWPLSRNERPKQFLDLLGIGKSLLQMTYERFLKEYSSQEIFIVTSDWYVDLVRQQLPELPFEQIITEPQRKNTAACIAYTAMKLEAIHPNATMIVAPADHLILEQDNFLQTIHKAVYFVQENNVLVTLGIQPTKPHTGYGYIQYDENKGSSFKPVRTFTEKPDLEYAKQFLASGDFLWNSGIFIWSTSKIIQEFQQHLPDIYEALSQINYGSNTEEPEIQNAYSLCPNISIDYGILEKAEDIFVLPSNFSWSDLGTWDALYDLSNKDNDNNVHNSELIKFSNSTKNIVHSLQKNKLIVLKDVEDLIVVDAEDALLVCKRDSEQKIKDIVKSIETNNLSEFL